MQVKAELAQWLLLRSWDVKDTASKPWPWADTYVAAQLTVESLAIKQLVMADASGEALAFGPGFIRVPTAHANHGLAIAAHRDTHFAFLAKLRANDFIDIKLRSGTRLRYQVRGYNIIDLRQDFVRTPEPDELMLVTCYPFASLQSSTTQRFVVYAQRAYAQGDWSESNESKPDKST